MNQNILIKHLLKKRSKSTAFTLIEIVVVLVLMGILFSFAVPNFRSGQQHQKLIESVEDLELSFYESFSRARNTNQNSRLVISSIGQNYYLLDDERITLPNGISFASVGNFVFTPPYGNLQTAPTQTRIWLQNDRQKTGLRLYPTSGLIERLPLETLSTRDNPSTTIEDKNTASE